jgi:hypothetical protein
MKNRLRARSSVSFGRIGSVERVFERPRRKAEGARRSRCCLGFLLFVVGLAALFGTAGCSGNVTSANGTTPNISIAITQAPPTSLFVGNSAQVSATVSNDIAGAGVDWVASCGSAPNCGSFSPSHTASGATAVFTAPLAVPAHNTVTVMALSSTDHSKAFSANVTILSTITGVLITQPPPATAPSGSLVNLAATVTGDPSNAGVDWRAACITPSGTVDCTPAGLHSAPGAPVTFVVPGPLQVLGIVGSTVTLTAFATADHSYSASASFTVTDPLSISLTQVPPTTMLTNATATVIATVSNDTTNAGVNWVVSCANAPCGSVSPSHTASGAPATFIAPPTVPAPNPSPNPVVTITATAAATGGPSVVTAAASVTIVAPISIKITQGVTPLPIVTNHTATLVATVTGDPTNAGVNWSCTPVGACGTFTPAQTGSLVQTIYTAPALVPTGGTVTITAATASTAVPTKTDTQNVPVVAGLPANQLLKGQFVMLLTAKNSSNGPYLLGGVISGDGNTPGTITGATFDVADASGNGTLLVHASGNYLIGVDGRGRIDLQISGSTTLGGNPFGASGAIHLSVAFVTPQHALLSEIDGFGDATGTLDLQNLQSWPAGGLNGAYSLTLGGFKGGRPAANYYLASGLTIPSTTPYSYITDQSDAGIISSVGLTTASQSFLNGASPDPLTGEIVLNSPVNLLPTTPFSLDLWVIDATHLVVTDWRDSVAGYLTAQPASPAISGAYAFTEAGATTAAQPLVAGGIFTCGASGVLDVFPLTGAGTPSPNLPITAACGTPANGRGSITISGAGSTGISKFAAYPTTDQGLYLIELDGGGGTSGPSGTGVALQQTAAAPVAASAFKGNYASNFFASTAISTAVGSESFAAQIISDGISALSGAADVNSFNPTIAPPGTPSSGATLSGSFTVDPSGNGRFPLTLTIIPGSGQPPLQVTPIHPACYIVDANTCMLLGLDATAPGTGILLLQNLPPLT